MEINEIRSSTKGYDLIYINIDNNNINDFFEFFAFAKEKGYTEIKTDISDYSSKTSLECRRHFSKQELKQVQIEMYKKDIEFATEQIKKLQNEN